MAIFCRELTKKTLGVEGKDLWGKPTVEIIL